MSDRVLAGGVAAVIAVLTLIQLLWMFVMFSPADALGGRNGALYASALAVWFLRDGTAHMDWFATAPFVRIEPGQQWGLPLLYLVFLIDVTLLYGACRWYDARRHPRRAAAETAVGDVHGRQPPPAPV